MDTSADDANVKGSNTTGNSSGLKEAEPSSSSSATKQSEPEAKPAAPVKDELAEAASDVFGDPDFLASVLGDLPGVDQNDASVQEVCLSHSKLTLLDFKVPQTGSPLLLADTP